MRLFLFDVDGTLAESGQQVSEKMREMLNRFQNERDIHLGIVGGGTFLKIQEQTRGIVFHHIFSECGTVYHKKTIKIYEKNLRHHHLFPTIQRLVRKAMRFISQTDYPISGHFIDLRVGIVYISLVGMQASPEERHSFLIYDKQLHLREQLIQILRSECNQEINILEGGSVGISVFPSEYDKVQVMSVLLPLGYDQIHYFGDKFSNDGNDYKLLNHPNVIGHPVRSPEDTYKQLSDLLSDDKRIN